MLSPGCAYGFCQRNVVGDVYYFDGDGEDSQYVAVIFVALVGLVDCVSFISHNGDGGKASVSIDVDGSGSYYDLDPSLYRNNAALTT